MPSSSAVVTSRRAWLGSVLVLPISTSIMRKAAPAPMIVSSTFGQISESMMWPSSSMTARAIVHLRDRDFVRANRGFVLELAAPVVPQVACDDLDDTAGRDGEERAENAEQLDAHQHADEHEQRVEVDGLRHDRHLQHVVLELLVHDEEDHDADARRHGMQERDDHGRDRAERGTDERDQVGEPDPEREDALERHMRNEERDERSRTRDDADHEVAEH